MKRIPFLFLSLFFLFSVRLLAQQTSPKELDQVVSGLRDYMSVRPQEKIHIHFDKPLYSVGDTIWFKVYLVNATDNRLSSLSKVVHVDINTPNGSTKHLVLPVNTGMAVAQLVLTDSLYTAGDYPLIAYTQWMRNDGEDYFFKHTLRVGDVLHYKATAAANFSETSAGLSAELVYTNVKGEVIQPQEVNYKLKNGDKVIFTGKLNTGSSGKGGIVFPADKVPKEGKLVLETSSVLASGSVLNNRFVVNTGKDKLALDFFPEGGALVNGIRSKVAFKAVGKDGLGISVKGYIENENGETVSEFQTVRFGMGVLALSPQIGSSYTAVVSDGLYQGQRFTLPKALAEGFVLSANRTEKGDLLVSIRKSAGMEAQTEVRLVVQANGEIQQAIKLPISTSSISFNIPQAKLMVGINQLTLFSADNRPLAERLIFVQQKEVATILQSEKPEYNTRDLIKLQFDNGENIVGGYSVAVVKADKVILPEGKQLSIYGNLLLTSDLKGSIEEPNYYFTNTDANKAAELDALLLSQGWRRFNWTEVLAGKVPAPSYKAEQGLEINGRITSPLLGKPVAGAKIKLLAAKEMLFLDTIADAQGRFSFKDLQLSDRVDVILRASGAKESNNVKVVLDEQVNNIPFFKDYLANVPLTSAIDTAMQTYLLQTSSLFDEMEKIGKIIQGTTLKAVEIVTKKKVPEIKGSVYPFAAAPPDYTFSPDKLQEMVNLETHLKGLSGVLVKQQEIWGYCPSCIISAKTGPMALLLNGSPINDLSGINPKSLTGVQIIKGGMASAGMANELMLNGNPLLKGGPQYGIVFLTMKGIPNKFIKPNRPPGFVQVQVMGYTYAREFYTPSYETKQESVQNDFRSTLFWKSDIITNENGKSEFSFYASDEPGKYRITLEGIGVGGQLCRKMSYFVVK